MKVLRNFNALRQHTNKMYATPTSLTFGSPSCEDSFIILRKYQRSSLHSEIALTETRNIGQGHDTRNIGQGHETINIGQGLETRNIGQGHKTRNRSRSVKVKYKGSIWIFYSGLGYLLVYTEIKATVIFLLFLLLKYTQNKK